MAHNVSRERAESEALTLSISRFMLVLGQLHVVCQCG